MACLANVSIQIRPTPSQQWHSGAQPALSSYSRSVLTDVGGIAVGHWTNEAAKTGCTTIVFPPGTIASGEVRGGAPASREFALLEPQRMVQQVDAVVLSGGSAFGLAAADGVAQGLEKQGRGFPTGHGPVPIVVGLSLFDLGVGDAAVRPGPAEGAAALGAASFEPHSIGLVGAGTGATVNKWGGPEAIKPGGISTATVRSGELVVSALLAVNAFGAIDRGDPKPHTEPPGGRGFSDDSQQFNTTIGVVATNGRLDKTECYWMAQSGHDGLARSIRPAHTQFDGDALVAAATGQVEADIVYLRAMAQDAVTNAVRSLPHH